jgi:hypothetical protein
LQPIPQDMTNDRVQNKVRLRQNKEQRNNEKLRPQERRNILQPKRKMKSFHVVMKRLA